MHANHAMLVPQDTLHDRKDSGNLSMCPPCPPQHVMLTLPRQSAGPALSTPDACEGLTLGLSPDSGLPCSGRDKGKPVVHSRMRPISSHLLWPMGLAAQKKGQLFFSPFCKFSGHVLPPGRGALLLSGTLSANPPLQEGSA